MPCPCGYTSIYEIGGPVKDCYYCESLREWGKAEGVGQETIDKEYFMRVAGLVFVTRKLEELGEDVSGTPPSIVTYEMAEAINDHDMYGVRDEIIPPPVPARLYRCNAGHGEIHALRQTARNYSSDIRSFENVFGFSALSGRERRLHAVLEYERRATEHRSKTTV